MAEDVGQLPRYTSTPLAGRKTSNIANSYFEVSPIFSTPGEDKNARSQIPVLKGGKKRPGSNGVRSVEAKKKVSSTSNSTGAGSSGLITMQPPTKKPDAVKKLINAQAPSQSPKRTQQRKVLPEENAQTCTVEVSSEGSSQPKPKVSEIIPAAECRNSIDKDAAQTKSITSRVSKVLQRPSTLPSVPEEVSVGGNGQLPGDCIFKKSEIQTGWLIPKESKTRVSLKRKSSVPHTITKRLKVTKNKDSDETTNQDDASLFDSPDIPNLVEVSSLQKKRQTYVVKKKPENTKIEEENVGSITDGIIPLEILSQKSSALSTSGGSTKEKSKKTMSKNSVKEKKENANQNASPNIEVHHSKRKLTKEVELSVRGNIESSNEKSPVEEVAKDKKQNEEEEELAHATEGNTKELEVDAKKKTSKRKYTKSSLKESNLSEEVNNEPSKNTAVSRKLRERKPNVQYGDSFVTTKENIKNKKESTAKTNKNQKETSKDTQVQTKTQRKKTVKENCSERNEIPTSSEADLENDGQKVTEDASSAKKDMNLKNEVDKGKINRPVEPINVNAKNKESKNSDNKKKGKPVIKSSSENLVEKEEIPTSHTMMETCTKTKARMNSQNSLGVDNVNNVVEPIQRSKHINTVQDNDTTKPVLQGTSSLKSVSNVKTKSDVPETKTQQQSVSKTHSIADKNQPIKPIEESTVSGQHNKEDKKNEQNVEEKKRTRRKTTSSKRDTKIQSVLNPENNAAKSVGLNRLDDRESCTETNNFASTSGNKSKSTEMDCATSHSDPAEKRCKHDSMRKVNSAERGFVIKELFGSNELSTHELQPGVTAAPSIHINSFLKMGEVRVEPGACLSKISTHTAYIVIEGTAQVTIKKHTQSFNASGENRRFFIPKSIDVSITNPGNQTLRMEFVKFRG